VFADGDLWTRNLEEAQAKAKKEGKSILMEFTGSDWCPPCVLVQREADFLCLSLGD